MGRTIRHYELPVPSTDTVSEATLSLDGGKALLRFDYYRDGEPKRAGLLFRGVVSTHHCSERCSTSRQTKAFDVLREIVDSEWVSKTRENIAPRYRDEFSPRHCVFYFDSVGGFEILADEFEVLPEETGSWEELNRTLMPI